MSLDYDELGGQASDKYLSEDVPLSESVEKIASKEDLNKHQTKRVLEKANKKTFLELFKEAEDKTFSFDLAKMDEIDVGNSNTSEKTASSHTDYLNKPDKNSEEFDKVADALGINDSEKDSDKLDELFKDKAKVKKLRTKVSEAKNKLENKIYDLKTSSYDIAKAIEKEAEEVYKDGYKPKHVKSLINELDVSDTTKQASIEAIDETQEKYAEIREWYIHNYGQNGEPEGTVKNLDHPIAKKARKLDKSLSKLEKAKEELKVAKDLQQEINDKANETRFIQDQ